MSKKFSKIISIITATFMLLTVFAIPMPVAAAESTVIKWSEGMPDGCIYFDTATGTLTSYTKTNYSVDIGTNIVIPDKINGVEVKNLSDNFIKHAFAENIIVYENNKYFSSEDGVLYNKDKSELIRCYNRINMQGSFTISNNVTKIGDYAFYGAGFSKISIPNSVVTIGCNAFSFCSNLTKISIPDSVTYLGPRAFYCSSNLKKVSLSKEIKTIETSTFEGCRELTEVDFPNGLKIIEENAFYMCNKIKEIFLPASVEKIANSAFLQLEGNYFNSGDLSYITVDNDNKHYCSEDGVLYNKSKKNLILYPKANERRSFTIPDGVEVIEPFAFNGSQKLYNITFPSSLKTIGEGAFIDNFYIKDFKLPEGVLTIESGAFSSKRNQNIKIIIPKSVNYIAEYIIYGSGEIYGYLGSYAETYAKEHSHTFIALDGVTETDLYSSYAKYLKNETYGNMCGALLTDVENILWSRSKGKNTLSAFKACLKKGFIGNLEAIYSGYSGNFTEEQELEKEIALELVYDVSGDSLAYKKVVDDVIEAYDLTDGANSFLKDIMEFGFSKPGSKIKAAEAISGGLFSTSDAFVLIESVEQNMGTLEKHMEAAGTVVDAADIAINIAASMEANNCVTKGIRDGIAKRNNTALYRGLTELIKVQRQSVETNTVDELIKYSPEKIVGAVLDVASGAFAVAEFAFNAISYIVPGADIDTVNKVVITSSNANVLAAAKTDAMTAMALNYQNGGKLSSEDLGRNYALLYTAYMESVKESVEYALQIATPAQKKKLQAHYDQYEEYLTYEKYIQSCIANANAQWKYSKSEDTITITGIVSDNVAPASNSSAVEELLIAPVYAAGEDDANIIMDIPEEINGMKVVAVSDNAFKDNTSLECISLPEETTSIGTSSFSGCTALHSVFLNEKLTSVGDEAFSGCGELKEIEVPYSVNEIGDNAFSDINDISIKAVEGSAASQYAANNTNTSLETVELKSVSITITKMPAKLSCKMSEEIDSAGIKVTAVLEDGSSKDVSGEVYCEFEDKQLGTNVVNVYYLDVATSYEVEVVADKCTYTISYKNEYGEEIAEPVSGSAMAGEEISLKIKDIKGYIPDNPSQKAVIGANNEFIVTYTSEPDINIEEVAFSEITKQSYTGKQIRPDIVVEYEGKPLVEGTDYYLDYGENINVGTGTVTIIGTGNYTGIKEIEFEISNPVLTVGNISLTSSNYSYTGKQIKPEPTVIINGKKLINGTDYTVSYGANKNPGYGSVTVIGIGDFTGEATVKFTIAKVTGLKAKSTGTNYIKLSWAKQPNVKGYKVYRQSGNKYKLIKTISGSKNTSYTVKKLSSGKGYKFKVRTYVGSKPYYGVYSSILSVPTKPGKVSLNKLSTGKTHYVKATWKQKAGTGYQVRIATNSEFTKNKATYTVKSYKTKTKTIKKLKKGKTYYVKVRAYKTYGDNTQYGAWSNYKKIKCK